MSLNLATILTASARECPNAPAILLGERTIDYAELDRAARGVTGVVRCKGGLRMVAVALVRSVVLPVVRSVIPGVSSGTVGGHWQIGPAGPRQNLVSSNERWPFL